MGLGKVPQGLPQALDSPSPHVFIKDFRVYCPGSSHKFWQSHRLTQLREEGEEGKREEEWSPKSTGTPQPWSNERQVGEFLPADKPDFLHAEAAR